MSEGKALWQRDRGVHAEVCSDQNRVGQGGKARRDKRREDRPRIGGLIV